MPERDARLVQLDFPQLTADMIRELRLTGTLGVFNLLGEVRPVYIVASRGGALDVRSSPPVFTSASIFNGFADVPAANAIIADTGALPAGNYDMFASISYEGSLPGVRGEIQLQHRNAANAATLAVPLDLVLSGNVSRSNLVLPLVGYTLGLNERFRVQLLGGNIVSGGMTASIGILIRPTP